MIDQTFILFAIALIFIALVIYFSHYKLYKKIEKINTNRDIDSNSIKLYQEAIKEQIVLMSQSMAQHLQTIELSQKHSLDLMNKSLEELRHKNYQLMEGIRISIEKNLHLIREDNAQKLESIRTTVDEKLHHTLEQRLGQSFKIVSERLEQVYKGIGEMQSLASGIGDLRKVFSNIKTRGIWGELQVENILQQILTSSQYAKNVQITKDEALRVDYAIKLPAKNGEEQGHTYIPIDAKFPLEVYHYLVAAQESGDNLKIEECSSQLLKALKLQAKTISEKYIRPPHTTEFAIMFVPLEALYAESLRIPGLVEMFQHQYRVMLTGPSTFAAILNSLQMGFKTLAIEKRTGELWLLLSKIKVEFSKFADILGKTKLKLEQATKIIGDAESKSRNIHSKLSKVEHYEYKNLPIDNANYNDDDDDVEQDESFN